MGQPSQAPESVAIGKHCLQNLLIAKPKHPLCYLKNYVLKQLLVFKSFYELNANPKVIPQVGWLKRIFYKHFPFLNCISHPCAAATDETVTKEHSTYAKEISAIHCVYLTALISHLLLVQASWVLGTLSLSQESAITIHFQEEDIMAASKSSGIRKMLTHQEAQEDICFCGFQRCKQKQLWQRISIISFHPDSKICLLQRI